MPQSRVASEGDNWRRGECHKAGLPVVVITGGGVSALRHCSTDAGQTSAVRAASAVTHLRGNKPSPPPPPPTPAAADSQVQSPLQLNTAPPTTWNSIDIHHSIFPFSSQGFAKSFAELRVLIWAIKTL